MSAAHSPADPVRQEVEALSALGLEALREAWAQRYGVPPPLRSVDFLRRLLAWRIQSDAFGGLDKQVLKMVTADAAPKVRGPQVREGVRLTREWQGRAHEVEVLADGCLYEGVRYASLSEVARAITGVRWNGPRFFGLRPAAK